MTMLKTLILGALIVGTCPLALGSAGAAFIAVDTFDNLSLGPIDEQNEWRASDSTSAVVFDPAESVNQVLSVATASTIVSHAAIIPDGAVRMLFLRFRYENQLSISFGISGSSVPTQFGHFDVELSLTSTRDDLRINDDGTYKVLTELEPGYWYNCWLLINNQENYSSIWLHDRLNDGATATDQLAIDGRTEIPFRGGSLAELKTFFIKTGGGDGVDGPLILDDIYLQNMDGLDLSNPTVVVAGVAPIKTSLQLHGASPNPFNPRTTISFSLDEPQSIELAVHDVSGRLVRRIASGVLGAGLHSIPWDGRDHAGYEVASGLYLVRLNDSTSMQTKKILLAR